MVASQRGSRVMRFSKCKLVINFKHVRNGKLFLIQIFYSAGIVSRHTHLVRGDVDRDLLSAAV